MILNGLKLAAAKKRIVKLVEQRPSSSLSFPITTLGIILDSKNEKHFDELIKIRDHYNMPKAGVKVFFYSGNREKPAFSPCIFHLKDFSIKAEINNKELLELTSQGVDLLITFAAEKNTGVHLLTAHIPAKIKVGRYQQNAALYDLILQTDDDARLFVQELIKYLNHFKKSKNE